MEKPIWYKEKGYLHISPSLQLNISWETVVEKIKNPNYIKNYGFYPLLHTTLSERKFKKGDVVKYTNADRKHTHYLRANGSPNRNIKERPIHYASHMDSLIYAYYAELLKNKYEILLRKNSLVDDAVIAYRKIETFNGSNVGKSNIHFAKECFDEIKSRINKNEEVAVLAIDLKSFFSSLDHKILKAKWAELLNLSELPIDHYKVFRSCTNFKYVLLDDLRMRKKGNGQRSGFDESKLASIRKKNGFRCFFDTNKEFREQIKSGNLPIYSNPFYKELANGKKVNKGIPQGLPISAVLANIYLYDFDLEIVNKLSAENGVYYRRYSDDIFIVSSREQLNKIETYIGDLIKKFQVKISQEKTEKFVFRNVPHKKDGERLECFKIKSDGSETPSSMAYLGFEFRGYHVGIKSTNLAKYYRKIISAVKRKARRATKLHIKDPHTKKAIFKNQVKKIYNLPVRFIDGDVTEKRVRKKMRYNLVINDRGFYEFNFSERKNKKQANYRSYINRCCSEFETDSFRRQISKSAHIANLAISKHFNI